MSAFASSDKQKSANDVPAQTPYTENCETQSPRENMTLIVETLLVLSLQLVFRATLIARHLSY
jgi:hypothetical protein